MKLARIATLLLCFPTLLYAAPSPTASSPSTPTPTTQPTPPAPEWIDLTHEFSSNTLALPTDPPFKLETIFNGTTLKGYYYNSQQFSTGADVGTHLDAPSHFTKNKRTIDKIPIKQLIGKAVIIDVSQQALPDDDYLITIGDIKNWEKTYGTIPSRSIVLFNTGYAKFWPDRLRYLGSNINGPEAMALVHFPGLAKDTAEWLVENRQIKAIGIDTANIDYGQTSVFPTHQYLSSNNIPIFENLSNLDQLYSPFAVVIALPMKIEGGAGAPLRIIAKALPYTGPTTSDPTTPSNTTAKTTSDDTTSSQADTQKTKHTHKKRSLKAAMTTDGMQGEQNDFVDPAAEGDYSPE